MMWGIGYNQHIHGQHNVISIINLCALTGNLAKPGCGPFSMTGQPNAMGERFTGGLTGRLPFNESLENALHRARMAKAWRVPEKNLVTAMNSQKPGFAVGMLERALKGDLKAMFWVYATHIDLPDQDNLLRPALMKTFNVVQEIYRHAPNNLYADVIFPAATWGEVEGSQQAAHWIRPPYARDELEFLLACTRCGACMEACPHEVIFPLAARLGITVAGTPALNLLHKGCHLCDGWPCVTACEPGALKRAAEDDAPAWPRPFARVWIDTHACLPHQGPECGACEGSCPIPGALAWDLYRPRIDPEHCVGCALCREVCIVEPAAIRVETLARSAEVT